ncbi:MAG: outer membrane protein assembly factor, partial [Thermotogae bacterium]
MILRRWAVLSILLFVCLTFPFTITNVVVKGLETVPLTSVLERIDYSGDLTEKDVEEIARTIFDMGYFASVKPELIPGKEGYTLLITVKENPKVKDWKITIDGEGLLDVKDLEKLVTIEKGKALNVKRVQESLENIKKAYEEAGYIFIEVTGNMRKDTFEIIVEEYALWDVFINGEAAGIDISQIVKEANLNLLKDFYSASPLVRFFTMNKKKFYPRVSDINRFIQTLRLNAFFSE